MVNPKRGELEINLANRKLSGKMTLDTLMRIEQNIGMSIVAAMRKLADGELTALETIAILIPVLKAGDDHLDEKEVKQIVWDAGITDAMREVSKILMDALNAGQDEGNEEAAVEPL